MVKNNGSRAIDTSEAKDNHGVFVAQSEHSLGELVNADQKAITLRNKSLDVFMKRMTGIKT